MKTNFDGIKKTAEKNLIEEVDFVTLPYRPQKYKLAEINKPKKVQWYHYLLIIGMVAVGYALAVLITL